MTKRKQFLGKKLSGSDPIKDSTPEAIKQLHDEGLQVVMITGDNKATAEAVGVKLDIDAVFSEVLPEEKAAEVKRLQDKGKLADRVMLFTN